jgi:hypothetical protein
MGMLYPPRTRPIAIPNRGVHDAECLWRSGEVLPRHMLSC